MVAWLSGFHAVEIALARQPERVKRVLLKRDRQDRRVQTVVRLAHEAGVAVEFCEDAALSKRVGHDRHQGALAEQTQGRELDDADLEEMLEGLRESALLLVLDEVSDPRNFGALIRVADGAGAHGVITTKHRSAPLSDVVHQTSAGAALLMPIYRVTNLARTLRDLKVRGVLVIGMADDTEAEWTAVDLRQSLALVVGAEGDGLRRLTKETCDVLVRLPMRGVASSLNVSVAAGIALYECLRQRSSL